MSARLERMRKALLGDAANYRPGQVIPCDDPGAAVFAPTGNDFLAVVAAELDDLESRIISIRARPDDPRLTGDAEVPEKA